MITDFKKRPLRDLRISVTDRCNLRCTYCMPADVYGERYAFLPRTELLSFEEIARLARIIVGLGAVKVRLTGGEPLVRSDIGQLVRQLAAIGGIEDLAMTTNGLLLPDKAQALREAGLARLTVSLDTLDDEVFKRINGRAYGTKRVLEGIEAAERAGFQSIKVNVVVQRGVNDHTIVDLARYFKGRGHIVRFIEFMDVGTVNGWKREQMVPAEEIVSRIDAEMPLEPAAANYPGEVATRYRYRDGTGEIGVIASVTRPFCGDCSRLRLSSDGELFTCLFAVEGIDLRGPLRQGATDEELEALISDTWRHRTDRYSEERHAIREARNKVEMYHIGG